MPNCWVWNGYGVCSNLASSGELPLIHTTTLTTGCDHSYNSLQWRNATCQIIIPLEFNLLSLTVVLSGDMVTAHFNHLFTHLCMKYTCMYAEQV